MDYLNLQALPDPILIEEILPQLPIEHLDKLYAINSRFNKICLNERLWQIKTNNEYPVYITKKPGNLSWRQYYKYLQIVIRQVPIEYRDNTSNITIIDNIDLTYKSTMESLSPKIIDIIRQKGYKANNYIIKYIEVTPSGENIISYSRHNDGENKIQLKMKYPIKNKFKLDTPFSRITNITIVGY